MLHAAAAAWLRPDAHEAWALLGAARAASGESAAAREAWQRAIDAAPPGPDRLSYRERLEALR